MALRRLDAGAPDAASALLLAEGAQPVSGALDAARALAATGGLLAGGPVSDGELRLFGWMLAPVAAGPLPFELNAVAAPLGEPENAFAGPIDVLAPGVVVAPRILLDEPLPDDDAVALVELTARARACGFAVSCVPTLAAHVPHGSVSGGDDRGRLSAFRALAARHPELAGDYRLPPALRAAFVEREVRLGGGRRVRALVRRPPLTMLVHAPGDESAAALREELRVRGDRYVLVAESGAVPHPAALDALIEALESAPYVAAAAPDAASLNGRCVLLAAGRFPQHVEPRGATLREALGALLQDVELLRRAVRAPGRSASLPRPPRVRTASAVFVVAAAPEVTRIALDAALAASGSDDELIGVCAASAETARRMLGAYPSLRVEADGADPLLTGALNRALGAARGELIFVVADDVLLPPATLRRLRDAFDRIPCLGAAFPCVPGAPLGEGVLDVAYADLKEMRALAERRENERAREAEPLDAAGTPAFAIAREALYAVGGIDPAYGPTRRGIADLVVRLRRAGYAVVRCDDTLAHRFDASASRSALALADAHDPVPVMPAPEILARGLSHAERVPFTSPAEARTSGTAAHDTAALCVVALPVGDARELERASAIVASAARAFDAAAPVRVHVLLDGAISPAEAAAALRRVLAASGRALETTVTVRVERSADIAAWRAALGGASRIVVGGGLRRAALSDCREIPVDEIPVLLQTAAP